MHARELELVQDGSTEAALIDEELDLLARVQKQLAKDQLERAAQAEYDQELLSLRDQISEARAEDLAPLIAEMYRMQALGAANGRGRDLPVDVNCPYFGHLKLSDGKKTRDVLIGNRGFVKAGSEVAIVDWRNAPVSRIYYRYEEGDDYEESFGGRASEGVVEARRTVSIVRGELRRVTWSGGSVARRGDGRWVQIPPEHRPSLQGGAGVAIRPPSAHAPPPRFEPGNLGVGDEDLREDKHLREITALIDPQQFELITKPESGIVILQGGAGSGKTTVALHRAAYLHFQDPSIFSPKKMAVVVKSEPLTEYISRVLPSLDVGGTPVVTLEGWMRSARKKVFPELQMPVADDVPSAVARLKKHPGMLDLLRQGVERDAASVRSQIEGALTGDARKAALQKWDGLTKQAFLPRLRELGRWLDGAAARRAGVDPEAKRTLQGILRRVRSAADDVKASWGDLLTDRELLTETLGEESEISPEDIEELVRWVSLQVEELPEADEEEVAPSIEDGPRGKLDPHDDALLLRLAQLEYGGLPIAGSSKTITYEHVIVDEAQDLSPTDIAVLRGALTRRESMTLAGDTAQKLIFDNGFEDWPTMLRRVGIEGLAIEQLKVSYRSTRPIVDFARHVLGPLADPQPPVVPRDGAPVEQFTFGSTGESIAFLGEALRALVLRERKANIAVVTRFGAQAETLAAGLRRSEVPAVRRVHGKDFSFQPGVDVVDVAQVKGLEYDYVVLAEVNASSYGETKETRHLLHIAATRAVHQLWVLSVQDPSPLLPDSLL